MNDGCGLSCRAKVQCMRYYKCSPPCASKAVESAPSASTNTGSPKLFVFEELWNRARTEFPYPPYEHIKSGRFYAEIIYDYIAKQLRDMELFTMQTSNPKTANKLISHQNEIDKMSVAELEDNLLTCDYRGIQFKKMALERYVKLKLAEQSE
jgi:hypothetical protein